MNKSLDLTVLTPDRKVVETTADSMQVLLPDGWWGILPGHAPMISHIHSSVIHYDKAGATRYIALYQGTIEVKQKQYEGTEILILTSAAEEGTDLTEVQSLLEQQTEKLEKLAKEADIEFNQIRLSLEKALKEVDVTNIRL